MGRVGSPVTISHGGQDATDARSLLLRCSSSGHRLQRTGTKNLILQSSSGAAKGCVRVALGLGRVAWSNAADMCLCLCVCNPTHAAMLHHAYIQRKVGLFQSKVAL
jgi:hypothetical protein